jgi:hypothetical protein
LLAKEEEEERTIVPHHIDIHTPSISSHVHLFHSLSRSSVFFFVNHSEELERLYEYRKIMEGDEEDEAGEGAEDLAWMQHIDRISPEDVKKLTPSQREVYQQLKSLEEDLSKQGQTLAEFMESLKEEENAFDSVSALLGKKEDDLTEEEEGDALKGSDTTMNEADEEHDEEFDEMDGMYDKDAPVEEDVERRSMTAEENDLPQDQTELEETLQEGQVVR